MICPKIKYVFIVIVAFLLSVISAVSYAQIPRTVNYQGYLTDSVGSPVDTTSGGPLQMIFTIYDDADTGSVQWTETQFVTVNQGVYSVVLGSNTGNPLTAAFDTRYYLEVQVETAAGSNIFQTLLPRQPLTGVPYALNADTVDGQHAGEFAASVHSHAGADISSGTVAEAYIDAAITRDSELTWGNLSGIPAGFADGDDNDTTYSAGTGLNLVGTTFSLRVPLALSGSSAVGIIEGNNSNAVGRGLTGLASGSGGQGVFGQATGLTGIGIWGRATSTGNAVNYGGKFEAYGTSGRGVYGVATGTNGSGVYGQNTQGTGVYGFSTSGWGVYGVASGLTGRGVYGQSTEGTAVYGLSNSGTAGYFTSDTGYGLIVENGNVGIGTTIPAAMLDVNGDINSGSAYQIGGSPVLAVNITSGSTFVGINTGSGSGIRNTFTGSGAGNASTTGNSNTFIGFEAGVSSTTGDGNTFIGSAAGASATDYLSDMNTLVGFAAGYSAVSGMYNTAVGAWAGHKNNMRYNAFYGMSSGFNNTDGWRNTFVGAESGYNNLLGNNNVFIGYRAGYSETGSDKLYIANNETSTLIYGDFSSGNVGIGTTTPASTLDVAGDVAITGNVNLSGQIVQEPWQFPALLYGWVNVGGSYAPARYFKDSMGIVHLEGVVTNGTSILVFTLPAGYRPDYYQVFAVPTGSGISTVSVDSGGNVTSTNGTNVSLSGITFRAP